MGLGGGYEDGTTTKLKTAELRGRLFQTVRLTFFNSARGEFTRTFLEAVNLAAIRVKEKPGLQ